MDNMDNNEMKDAGSKKPPVAVLIWLLIFVTVAILLVYKLGVAQGKDWDQTKFEQELTAGKILTADISEETDKTVFVEGKYKADKSLATPEKTPSIFGTPETGVGYYKVRLIYSDEIAKLLKQNNVKVDIKPKEKWWSWMLMTILPIFLVFGLIYFLFSRQIKMAGKGAMQFGRSKARMILPDEHKTTFDDIAGADEAKEETKEVVDYLKDPLKFKLLGGRIPKGALLMGSPGTGKTLMAKAVAGEADVPFFSISGSDFVEMFVGVGASRVRDMFEQARKHCPCLIFIDEIDAVGRSRFSGIGGGHDEREQTLNALLVEMDGLETQEGVIILAATNRPDVLDPALLRPGRFDRQIVLDLPDIKGRKKILEVHGKKIKMGKDVNLETIAKGTPGFSGADLANLINEAALLAARNDRDAAIMDDLEEARDKVRWGRERKSRRISEKERKITAYHEAGHTLIALHTPNSMPLHKVTIIPRGQAYLGATMHLPDEDRYTESKSELLDELAVMMGGRMAEKIIFEDITSGAAGDIEQATKIARLMVCAYGMSDVLGVIQYGKRSEHIYLGRDIVKDEPYSEVTAREIDLEIKGLVEAARDRAEKLLLEHKDQLIKLAEELLEKETLDASEVKKLLGMPIDNKKTSSETTISSDKESDESETTESETEPKTGSNLNIDA
jgi:cell division protease FtsH